MGRVSCWDLNSSVNVKLGFINRSRVSMSSFDQGLGLGLGSCHISGEGLMSIFQVTVGVMSQVGFSGQGWD